MSSWTANTLAAGTGFFTATLRVRYESVRASEKL
jgi:hypothetical protein